MSGFDHDLEPLEVAPRTPPPSPSPSGRSRGVRRRVTVAVAVVVVLGALAAVARDRSGGSEPSPAVEDDAARFWSWGADGSGDEAAPPGWRRGDPGPIPTRKGHVVAWSGAELLVWGGDPSGEGTPIGAAYDLAQDRWRAMAPAPFPVRTQAVAAWSGFELLVWGGQEPGPRAAATGGAYDPLADRWRTLATAPLAARVPLAGVWTGQELVVAGGTSDGRRAPSPEAAAYDPAADRWRVLPPMPVTLTDAVGLWTGSEVVVLGAALDTDNSSLDPEGRARVAAYDPARNRWRALPPPPLSPQAITAVWSGDRIFAWDYELHASGFDPSAGPEARWYGLPDLPLDFTECYPKGAWADDVVFAEHCGQGAVYRLSTADWTRVAHPRHLDAPPVWTGDELLFWVGRLVGSDDGLWRFRPPPPRPVGPVPPVLGAKRR